LKKGEEVGYEDRNFDQWGDAPGMNAAVRAVARTAFFRGWEVMGVWAGYRGLLEGRISPMDWRRLGGIINRGGTVLGTERSPEFATPEGQRSAEGKLAEAEVEGLVVIGGNGSLTGGLRLAELGDDGGLGPASDGAHERQIS